MKILPKLLVVFAFFCGIFSAAFADFSRDLAVDGSSIAVVPNSGILVGDTVRVYATITNSSAEDLIGTVKFFVDDSQVASDQPVSVKSGSVPDEVFILWPAVAGNHKIGVRLTPYEPEGDNPANNFAEATVFVDADTDGDGVGNSIDTDDDNDTLSDSVEAELGTNPLKKDTDNDGIIDPNDLFPTDPGESADTDLDGSGDNADSDDDNDGLSDLQENEIGTNPTNPDTDGDSGDLPADPDAAVIGGKCSDLLDKFPLDAAECFDSDEDGVGDNSDVFPNDASESADCDGDGIGNNADPDDDNDGHLDADDAFACDPAAWQDSDGDRIADIADPDDDNDGVPDWEDEFPLDGNEWQDSDRDGLGDNADPNDANQGPVIVLDFPREVIVGQPTIFDASGSQDVDGDGVRITWDFGDGSPIEENLAPVHTFEKIGIYTIRVTATDSAGESRVREVELTVENSAGLEMVLLWLFWLLIILLLAIVWRTVTRKQAELRKRKKKTKKKK